MGDDVAALERGFGAEPCPKTERRVDRDAPSNTEVAPPDWLADVIRRQEQKIDLLVGIAREQGSQIAALTAALPPISPPPKKPKRRPVKQGSFREEHLMLVMANAPNLLTAVYIAAALDTGLRRSELLALQWSDIDGQTRAIEVRFGKGGKRRTVFTTQRAISYMLMLPRFGPWVFSRETGRPPAPNAINAWVKEAVERSGIEAAYGGRKIRVHAMRRGHATNSIERGVDLRTVQAQLGHSSITITEGYIDSRDDHRERMRDRFEAAIAPAVAPSMLGLAEEPRRPPRRNQSR